MKLSSLLKGFFVVVIVLSILSSYRFVNLESTVVLIVFNLLFIGLAFQLSGKATAKIGLLALGNLIGFLWNFIFHTFADAGVKCLGATFNEFYILVYPFLNALWIVSFWSLSLTFLRYYRIKEALA
ncbi:MAG: hypothetical protein NWE98_02740 [Candidatus Bathyarchaeota archaeon]|nr:hypothetical protein [Candidatus Bathyarchaeota archaeon]